MWHEMGDGCWTPGHGDNPQGAVGGPLLQLGRPPRHCRGHGGAAGVVAGDEETDQGRRLGDGSWHCPGGGCREEVPGSIQAVRVGRAGCTWGAGWTLKGRWAGGRNAHRRQCNWAGAGWGMAVGTEQRSWRVAAAEGHRGSVRGPGAVPCPGPSHGVMPSAHSRPALPSLGNWRRLPRCSVGVGLVGVGGWLRRAGRKVRRLGGQAVGWLGRSSEGATPQPPTPVRWEWWVVDCASR